MSHNLIANKSSGSVPPVSACLCAALVLSIILVVLGVLPRAHRNHILGSSKTFTVPEKVHLDVPRKRHGSADHTFRPLKRSKSWPPMRIKLASSRRVVAEHVTPGPPAFGIDPSFAFTFVIPKPQPIRQTPKWL
ncbi:uncharacterized protein EHS24_006432 [Apiotrichum porosum]|uniref:Uncharacterized protein n=1 Tax=Apiotrichum porosum TaxID=105984 RepID=A0A427Y155_9TREE|nr:uncharacterized protein EHS24_006432 [Apiotrichum porosum]RSH84894.1 hypothetical protein EHS24_006432 [Apiotrichum porosum]